MFRKRALAILVTIFALGVGFGVIFVDFYTFSFRVIFSAVLAITVVIIAVSAHFSNKSKFKYISAAAFAVAAFSLGLLRVSLYNEFANDSSQYDDKNDSAVYEITEIKENSIYVRVLQSDIGVPKGRLVKLYLNNLTDGVLIGDKITCEVDYDYKNSVSLFSNGVTLSASGSVIEHSEGNGLFYAIRKSVAESSQELYGSFEYASAISRTVTIGDRSDMDSYLFSVYKSAGISHILAISGLHISIISMSLYNFLLSVSVNRKLVCIISVLFSVAYTALVGFTPGAVRATVMMLIVLVSRMFLRKADGFTSLFIALLLLLIVNPYSLFSAGLQLSFLCSFGIMLSDPLVNNINAYFSEKIIDSSGIKRSCFKILSGVTSSVITSFSASIFSFPVLCISFDTISYISPLINLFVVPVFSYAVLFVFISFLIAPIVEFVAVIIAFPVGYILDLITKIAVYLYDNDIGIISAHIPFMIIPLVLSFLMIGVLIFSWKRRTALFLSFASAFCISLLLCGIYYPIINKGTAIVEYGDQQGEYAYIFCENKSVYIDMGGYTSYPDAVYKNGYTSLDSYVLLDYNSFSLQRLKNMSGNLKISRLYLPQVLDENDSYIYNQIIVLANERNCDIMHFDEVYSATIGDDLSIWISGVENKPNEETLILIEVNGNELCILDNGYDNAVNSDIVVVTDKYSGDSSDIICIESYAPKNYLEKHSEQVGYFNEFDNSVRIIFDISESSYKIYEP